MHGKHYGFIRRDGRLLQMIEQSDGDMLIYDRSTDSVRERITDASWSDWWSANCGDYIGRERGFRLEATGQVLR
jgi:hypothetical protein